MMKPQRIHLDYVRPAHSPWLGRLLLAFAIILFLIVEQQVNKLQVEYQALQQVLAKSTLPKVKKRTEVKEQSEESRQQTKAAQELAAFLTLPWRDLFAGLEIAASDDVMLLSLEPDPRKQQLRISAEAKDFNAIVSYMKHLSDAPQLELVRLEHYQQQEDSPTHALRFSLLANWKL